MDTEKVHRFRVEGMTCHGCEESIERVVRKITGVRTVQASHRDRSVILTLAKEDDAILDEVRAAVIDAGFKVTRG
jgi:copper chaperone CopZ